MHSAGSIFFGLGSRNRNRSSLMLSAILIKSVSVRHPEGGESHVADRVTQRIPGDAGGRNQPAKRVSRA